MQYFMSTLNKVVLSFFSQSLNPVLYYFPRVISSMSECGVISFLCVYRFLYYFCLFFSQTLRFSRFDFFHILQFTLIFGMSGRLSTVKGNV